MSNQTSGGTGVLSYAVNIGIFVSILVIVFLAGWLLHRPPTPDHDIAITEPTQEFQVALRETRNIPEVLGETSSNNTDSTNNSAAGQEQETHDTSTTSTNGQQHYVASVNGKRYYPVECSAANSIKEENKRYYATEQEAQNDGKSRTISQSCNNDW